VLRDGVVEIVAVGGGGFVGVALTPPVDAAGVTEQVVEVLVAKGFVPSHPSMLAPRSARRSGETRLRRVPVGRY
jgi:hypothetical protein